MDAGHYTNTPEGKAWLDHECKRRGWRETVPGRWSDSIGEIHLIWWPREVRVYGRGHPMGIGIPLGEPAFRVVDVLSTMHPVWEKT